MIDLECLNHWLVSLPKPLGLLDLFANTVLWPQKMRKATSVTQESIPVAGLT